MTQEALKLALEFIEDVNFGEWRGSTERQERVITAIKEALAQPEQEPVAWRTFDGEGQYEYRAYEENESYADEWDKRNPNHKGWVDPLYTHPPQCTWVNLTRTQMQDVYFEVLKEHRGGHQIQGQLAFGEALQAKIKEKNT